MSVESHSTPAFFIIFLSDYEPIFTAQDFEKLNSIVKLNRNLKQFRGITKSLPFFFFFPYLFCFKAKSDLNYNYKIEINHGFVAKYF